MRVLSVALGCVLVLASAREAAPASTTAPLTDAHVRAIMTDPQRHVRGVGAGMSSLIADGMRRSGTFAALVLALNKSSVIVYIESVRMMPTSIAGRLLLAAGPEGYRYLRIQVTGYPRSNETIALVAHELRHAIEVAESPDVRDVASLIALYRRIGHSTPGRHQYDTVAAQDAGRTVRAELVG